MKKRLLALALAALMMLSLVACGPKDDGNADATPTPDQQQAEMYVVGICQLAPHPALPRALLMR